MSLQRKENNLRKAQARLDRIQNPPRWKVISHLKNREFQIDFRREQTKSGKFRTRAYIVRDAKAYHGNHRGLIHKAVNLKYRIKGDKPSVTRFINSAEPTTKKGRLFKKTAQVGNFALHDVKQTAVDTVLAAETVGIKTTDIAQREIKNKLRQKYTREAVDDYHRGVFFVGRTAVDALKGTHQYFKQKRQHKLEKAKFKLKKADYAVFKAKTYQPKLKANQADLKSAKAEYKSKIVKDNGNHLRKAMNKRRSQSFKQSKHELKFEHKQLKTDKKFRVKELRNQRKISKNSSSGLLALKPAAYTAGRMKASAWQKAVNEDSDNDMLHAVDSAKRRVAEPVAQKVSKPQRLQRQEKKRDSLSDKKLKSEKKLNRQENRLKSKHDSYKKRKKKPKPKSSKTAKKSVANAVKAVFKFVENIYKKETAKFFAVLAIFILIIFLMFAIIIMIFSSSSSGGTFLLGTYAAQDYDLSEAEKYYTELVYNLNQKILKVSDAENWKDGLADFGANKDDLKDTPNEWIFGKSSVYDWEPQYDFDCYKLWAFLCAYYYDFDAADNGDIKYWKFRDGTKTLLEEIFNAEYEFCYWYDNTSGWECKYQFESQGYYSLDGSGISGEYGYINISYPDALPFQGYNNGNTIYFNLSNGEVLNCNDNYSATGWYLKNQFVDDYDNSGTKYGAWYVNGEQCSFGIWEDDVLKIPIPYVITDENWCSFLQKYEWKTDCRLYYNVKQNKTFEEIITEKLVGMSHSDERLQYYTLLAGKEDGTGTLNGNHQTLHNLLPGATIRDYDLKRQFGYEMTGWNNASDGLYQGIKVYCTNGETLKAPFKCKITNINTDENKITVRKDDVEYWYDGNGGTKRDTEVTIANAVLLSEFSEGDTINDGQEFAKTTAENVNFHINIDTDGNGWDYIDPRLVLY